MKKLPIQFLLIAGVCCFLPATVQAQLNFNISSTGNANADAGFQMAADYWSSHFDDNVTINITAAFEDLGTSVLGSSQNAFRQYSYSSVRSLLSGSVVTDDDQTFVDNLPTGSMYDVYINRTTDNPNGSGSSIAYVGTQANVQVNRANAKAIGLIAATDAGNDSTIRFNSNSRFNFDFDPTNGIGANQLDFVGIAIHEIGHTMGFSSQVDQVDGFGNILSLEQLDSMILDFARFSADSEAAGADMDMTADTRAKYFSIDGGATAAAPGLNHWSLGGRSDGRQASHWKDNLGLGIMDPTAAPEGQLNVVTELDLQAIDIIGWDRVVFAIPEPAAGLVSGGLLTVAALGRRRRRVG